MNLDQQSPWQEPFHERFHIFAHGETFDVDAYLAATTLRPDSVWRRSGGLSSGVEFFLGDGRAIRLPDQEEQAIAYLKEHRDELRALAQFPGVNTFILGLVFVCGLHAHGCCVGPPGALMWYALDVGIEPRYYVTIDGRPAEVDTLVVAELTKMAMALEKRALRTSGRAAARLRHRASLYQLLSRETQGYG